MLRSRAHRAAEVEETLLERLSKITGYKELPSAVRAAADVKSKSIDGLMKMTGRVPSEGSSDSLESMIAGMEAKGIMRMTVDLEKTPAKKVDAEAQVTDG
jgi:hypothetical protein